MAIGGAALAQDQPNRLEVWDRVVWEGQEDSLVSAVKKIGPGAVGGHTS